MNRDARQILTELLVLRAQGGDADAFSELYRLWNPDLRRMARVAIEHAVHVDEVAQDAWVTIARGIGRLADPACFPRWAFRILDRRCSDWIRRRQTDRQRGESLTSTPEAGEVAEPAAGHAPGRDAEGAIALREAIALLEPGARTLLHLFYEQAFTIPEIGEILGVPAGTVKSRLFTLRQTLKASIERIHI